MNTDVTRERARRSAARICDEACVDLLEDLPKY
jgi:hypothetical protein